MRQSWTQPICDPCWEKKKGNRVPIRTVSPPEERCAYCGAGTRSGIYVRANPSDVPFPATEED